MAEKSEQIEENLVKKTCRELGITQKELAEIMEVTPHTITNWTKGKIDKTIQTALEGLLYKNKFESFRKNIEDIARFTL
jgi:DNA-binding XRE family transcriptional regulator